MGVTVNYCREVDVESIGVKIAEGRGCAGARHAEMPKLSPFHLGTGSFFKARGYIVVFAESKAFDAVARAARKHWRSAAVPEIRAVL